MTALSLLALSRPSSWNFPLFVHVLGAMIVVGGLVVGASCIGFARGETRLLRLGYWSLLALSLPGWIVLYIGALWVYSREGWDDVDEEPAWLELGWLIADLGGLILLVSLIVGGIGMYRLRQDKGAGLLKATLVLSLVLLAACVVAVWAMAGKPD
jgi:hypothetical protein